MSISLEASGQRIVIDPSAGGRAVSWVIDGHEVLAVRSPHPVEHGMYVMAPWAGRLRDNAITWAGTTHELPATYECWALHGTVLDRAADVIDQVDGRLVLTTDLGPTFPWRGCVRTTWEVDDERLLTSIALEADDEPFPGVVGWHPWFRRVIEGHRAEWVMADARIAEREADYRLSGELREVTTPHGTFDDAFFSPACTARIAWDGLLAIEVRNSHPWFVVFDALPDFLCLEPQSGPPNGVNDAIVGSVSVARPGAPLVMRTEWRIRRDRPADSA